MFIIKFVPFLYTFISPFVHVMAPNYSDFAPKRYRCKADSLNSILDVLQVLSFETLGVFLENLERQWHAIAHDGLFRVAPVLLSRCCELRNLQRKTKILKKSSHWPGQEREGGVSLPWVPEVKTGEFASLQCSMWESRASAQILCNGSVML